jgi:hypothetical protein
MRNIIYSELLGSLEIGDIYLKEEKDRKLLRRSLIKLAY